MITAWTVGSLDKVKADSRPPRDTEFSPVLRFSAARGEVEAAQLCVHPVGGGVKIEAVDIEPFHGHGLSIVPRVRLVDFVNVTEASHGDGEVGPQPDILREFVPVKLETTRSFWGDVKVPREAPAGLYSGNIHIRTAGAGDIRVPITLRVFNFELPWPPRLVTGYGLYEKPMRTAYGERYDDMFRRFRENMTEHRITHLAFPAVDITLPKIQIPAKGKGKGKVKVDYTEFDRAVQENLPRGMNRFEMPVPAKYLAKEKRLDTPYPPDVLVAVLAEFEQHLEQRGWLDMAYFFLVDEPGRDAFPVFEEIQNLLKRGAPRIRRRLDMGYGAYGAKPGEVIEKAEYRKLKGLVEIWVPHIDCVDQEFLAAEQAEGREVWWYICCSAKHPYPNCLVDYPLIDSRVPMWMTFDAGATGFVYWTVNWWDKDPFVNPLSYAKANGDGMLIYPGPDGPLDSVRWEVMRDGFEDYDYLVLLSERLRAAEKAGRTGPAVEIARSALAAVKQVASSRTQYAKDPNVLLTVRTQVAHAIEGLGVTPQ